MKCTLAVGADEVAGSLFADAHYPAYSVLAADCNNMDSLGVPFCDTLKLFLVGDAVV